MKRKIMFLVYALTAVLATFLATTSAYASFPWISYQPKAPKSLIK